VADSDWRIPVRLDHELRPLDHMLIGRTRWHHTPSLNESFRDVGSRSKGPGEMERSSPGWLRVSVANGDLRH
jgi:hypothetical protein